MPRGASTWRSRSVWLWWSGGKDSAWVLQVLQSDPNWNACGLIVPVNAANGRVMAHGVRHDLVEAQAKAVDLPLIFAEIDWRGSNTDYDVAVRRALAESRRKGAEGIALQDLSLDRNRRRRTTLVEEAGLEPVFPLWGRDPGRHVRSMLEAGLRAWICATELGALSVAYVGRRYDEALVADLPEGIDPTGENGEFRTFVEWAPGWRERVDVRPTSRIQRYGYAFAELELETETAALPGDSADIDPFDYFQRLGRVRDHVDLHLGVVDRDAAAAVAAMTPSAFSHFFHDRVGVTFSAWLARRRVERAVELLGDKNLTLSQVAQAVGFQNSRSFRRSFHRHMGCSPSTWKQRLQAPD